MFKNIYCFVDSLTQRRFAALVLPLWHRLFHDPGGAYEREPGCIIHAVLEGYYLERHQPLVMIHGQYGIVAQVIARPEQAIGRERTVDKFPLIF